VYAWTVETVLGQLSPSKSIVGCCVNGLEGLVTEGVGGEASSRGSRACPSSMTRLDVFAPCES